VRGSTASGAGEAEFHQLLREVSRSFYFTVRVLPKAIRQPIALAYMLARATDTIADTGAVPEQQRLAALRALADRIARRSVPELRLPDLEAKQSTSAERVLLGRIEEFVAALGSLDEDDLRRVQKVLETIISGQQLDLLRFGQASASAIVPLQAPGELDDYTYRVAGCVGEFWTAMCLARLRPKPRAAEPELAALGVRFGKALQLINILRDIPADLRLGRCYLPASELQAAGLAPADLLMSQNEARFRPVYNTWLAIAEDHLRAGWRYTLALPGRWARVRLACAWPILIGVATLEKLKTENVLDPGIRIKASRAEVKSIMRQSVLALPFKNRWAALPHRLNRDF
jgi:farnesyl-diphosphate farnesyltransferase